MGYLWGNTVHFVRFSTGAQTQRTRPWNVQKSRTRNPCGFREPNFEFVQRWIHQVTIMAWLSFSTPSIKQRTSLYWFKSIPLSASSWAGGSTSENKSGRKRRSSGACKQTKSNSSTRVLYIQCCTTTRKHTENQVHSRHSRLKFQKHQHSRVASDLMSDSEVASVRPEFSKYRAFNKTVNDIRMLWDWNPDFLSLERRNS